MSCELWETAIKNNTIKEGHEEFVISTGLEYEGENTYQFIDYCPFCGFILDENGCSNISQKLEEVIKQRYLSVNGVFKVELEINPPCRYDVFINYNIEERKYNRELLDKLFIAKEDIQEKYPNKFINHYRLSHIKEGNND